MFCPSCGSILRPVQERVKGKLRTVVKCGCGYRALDGRLEFVERAPVEVGRAKPAEKEGAKAVPVVERVPEMLPLVDERCPKCGHGKAYYWTAQTRAADEPETIFYRCTRCSHNWREY